MAMAARYQRKRKDSLPRPAEREKGAMADSEAKARAIAANAARRVARRASPRVRKSAARRAQEAVLSAAKRSDIDTPESMRQVVRVARRVVRSVKPRNMGARSNTARRAARTTP